MKCGPDREVIPDDFYKYELLALAQAMHSATTGASDCPHPEVSAEWIRWMRMRLDSWQPSAFKGCAAFDACARALCEIALAEFRP